MDAQAMTDIDAYNDFQLSKHEQRFLEPEPDKCLYGFYIGDRVEITNPFMSMWPDVDHVEKFGDVIGFDREYIEVRHGSRIDKFYHEDLRKV
jgi:hypothetical protein